MFTVIGCMLAGVLVGFLLRRHRLSRIGNVITFLIWLLLFLLGVEVGGNERVLKGLPTLGVEALVIAVAATLGSCLAAWGLWVAIKKREAAKKRKGKYEVSISQGDPIIEGSTKNRRDEYEG